MLLGVKYTWLMCPEGPLADMVRDLGAAVVEFSGPADNPRLHVVTYKGLNGAPPDIVRFDYAWADVK